MNLQGHSTIVAGGGSGLGAVTTRALAAGSARVAVLDIQAEAATAVAAEIGGLALPCDITNEDSVTHALDQARAAHGPLRVPMNVAGIGGAKRLIGRDGAAMPLAGFRRSST